MSVCEECASYLADNPHLIGACASVGIEHKKSTEQMVQDFMAGVHRRDCHPTIVRMVPAPADMSGW